jgi:hypothetical protein
MTMVRSTIPSNVVEPVDMRNIADRLSEILDQGLVEALTAAKSRDFNRSAELLKRALQQLKLIANDLSRSKPSAENQDLRAKPSLT